MEENRYRTSGVIDETTYREIEKYSLSRGYVWFIRIAAVVMAIFALLMLIVRNFFLFVVFVTFTILFIWQPRRLVKSHMNAAVKRLYEMYPAGSMQVETWFTGEGVAMHNLSNGGQLVLPYETLRRVAETERYFYLVTRANQFILVFKGFLTSEQRRSFLPFLREKCPDIKVVR